MSRRGLKIGLSGFGGARTRIKGKKAAFSSPKVRGKSGVRAGTARLGSAPGPSVVRHAVPASDPCSSCGRAPCGWRGGEWWGISARVRS